MKNSSISTEVAFLFVLLKLNDFLLDNVIEIELSFLVFLSQTHLFVIHLKV